MVLLGLVAIKGVIKLMGIRTKLFPMGIVPKPWYEDYKIFDVPSDDTDDFVVNYDGENAYGTKRYLYVLEGVSSSSTITPTIVPANSQNAVWVCCYNSVPEAVSQQYICFAPTDSTIKITGYNCNTLEPKTLGEISPGTDTPLTNIGVIAKDPTSTSVYFRVYDEANHKVFQNTTETDLTTWSEMPLLFMSGENLSCLTEGYPGSDYRSCITYLNKSVTGDSYRITMGYYNSSGTFENKNSGNTYFGDVAFKTMTKSPLTDNYLLSCISCLVYDTGEPILDSGVVALSTTDKANESIDIYGAIKSCALSPYKVYAIDSKNRFVYTRNNKLTGATITPATVIDSHPFDTFLGIVGGTNFEVVVKINNGIYRIPAEVIDTQFNLPQPV